MSGRHQNHATRNRNRRLRLVSPIQTQRPGDVYQPSEGGRLKQIPLRQFKFNVPFELGEGKHSWEDAPDPVNQLGALIEGDEPVVTSNDFESFLAAFNKRCNFEATDDIDPQSYSEACELIDSLPDLFEPWEENDEDRERWLNKFTDRKRQQMERAFEDVCDADYSYIGTKDLSVKQEVLMKRNDDTWAPRVIYAGNDAFNTITGPPAMIMMERFCHLCSQTPIGPIEIMPAYKKNDVELAAFLMDSALPETIEGDYSRNDREQRKSVAHLFDRWQKKLGMPQWFRTLNMKIEHFKVQNKQFGFKAKLKYQLPTGTTNTTVRNSTYNATMTAVACKRQNRKGKGVVLGDDLLAKLNKRFNLNKWTNDIASFKMVLKAKSPDINGHATFLSRRLILETDTPCMVPLIGKMIARFNARGTSNMAVSTEDYMAGKSLSYAYECRHVPWLRSFYLKRYLKYANVKPVLDELTWFTRTSGIDSIDGIVKAIEDEEVLVTDDEFEFFLLHTYDADLIDLEELMNEIILCDEPVIKDIGSFNKFRKDIE